jgi:hypothetical protein
MGGQSALQGALSGIGENAMAASIYNRRYPAASAAPAYSSAAYQPDLNPFGLY